jgi:hypothetical protein
MPPSTKSSGSTICFRITSPTASGQVNRTPRQPVKLSPECSVVPAVLECSRLSEARSILPWARSWGMGFHKGTGHLPPARNSSGPAGGVPEYSVDPAAGTVRSSARYRTRSRRNGKGLRRGPDGGCLRNGVNNALVAGSASSIFGRAPCQTSPRAGRSRSKTPGTSVKRGGLVEGYVAPTSGYESPGGR